MRIKGNILQEIIDIPYFKDINMAQLKNFNNIIQLAKDQNQNVQSKNLSITVEQKVDF